MEKLNIKDIKPNQENPRKISNGQLDKLKKSIQQFPEMLELRPLVIDENNVVLGGNMRLKALQELGVTEVSIKRVENFTEDQKREFIIKDNIGYGEWDFDVLDINWNKELLLEWGLDFIGEEQDDEKYTRKIEAPTYSPSNEVPEINSLVDVKKKQEMITKIQNANITQEEKLFLTTASNRHLVFDYAKIADYYSHASKEMQELMEESALIIIDYNKAIENGYVKLSKNLAELYSEDHDEE
jgi:hypothetical protein